MTLPGGGAATLWAACAQVSEASTHAQVPAAAGQFMPSIWLCVRPGSQDTKSAVSLEGMVRGRDPGVSVPPH